MSRFKSKYTIVLFALIFAFMFSGCSADTTPAKDASQQQPNQEAKQTSQSLQGDQFEVLRKASDEFLKETDLEYMSVDEVYENIILEGNNDYFIVDVRGKEPFAKGNIQGSVFVDYNGAGLPHWVDTLPKDKKIVVVCYSGHTANQTVATWGMLGYDAIPMFNGMGGWTDTPGLGSALPETAFDFPVETQEVKATKTYELPELQEEGVATVNELIMKRAQGFLESGKGPIVKPEDLMDSIKKQEDKFFTVDIRSAEDYKKGHVPGAINLPYKTIAEVDNLKKLPTDKKLVVVGYSGNDASQIVRVLNQLGYDSYAMFRGMRVWTSNEEINGIAPISTEKAANYPTKVLNVDLEGGGGSASCG